MTETMPMATMSNREGYSDFNVAWGWGQESASHGFTAVLRAKDEARSMPWVLQRLLLAVDRVILIDNESTDGTPDIARKVAYEEGAAERLDVHSYPFAVSRCGPEHLATPADSVHSLAYFYNWSFSHVRTTYALKWDGDMVLTDRGIKALRDLSWQLEAVEAIVNIPRYPLYVATDDLAFLDIDLINREPWGWPNRPGYTFGKALEWELPLWPDHVQRVALPDWMCVELKHLDTDEFDHWSHTNFDQTSRTKRKQREWEVFHSLADGGDPPEGVVRIEAPSGTHVIDHVQSAAPAELGITIPIQR